MGNGLGAFNWNLIPSGIAFNCVNPAQNSLGLESFCKLSSEFHGIGFIW